MRPDADGWTAGRLGWPVVTAAFVVLLAFFLLTGARHVGPFDEGIILTGALRVLGGEWPSRDFYTNYGPGQFVLLAAVMALLGVDTLAARILDAIQLAAATLVAGLLLARLLPLPQAIGGAFIVAAVFTFSRSELYPINTCILLALCIAHVLIARLPDLRGVAPCWPVVLLLTVMGVFRYDLLPIGAAAFLVPSAIVLMLQWRERQIDARSVRRIILVNAAALAGVVGVVFGGLAAAGILVPAVQDIVTHNTATYLEMRSLPFPDWRAVRGLRPDALLVYLAPASVLLAGAALPCLARTGARQSGFILSRDARAVALVTLACASAFFYTKGFVRTSAIHMLLANIPAVVLAIISAQVLGHSMGRRLGPRLREAIAAAPLLLGVAVLTLLAMQRGTPANLRALLAPEATELRSVRLFTSDPATLAAARHVRDITQPGERILSATGRHDKIFVNDIAFYFLAGRLPGTRWHQYDPGVQTSSEVQMAMIADLDRGGVRVVVVNRSWDDVREPNRSAESSGVTLLDDVLAAEFELAAEFGSILVLQRRGTTRRHASPDR